MRKCREKIVRKKCDEILKFFAKSFGYFGFLRNLSPTKNKAKPKSDKKRRNLSIAQTTHFIDL